MTENIPQWDKNIFQFESRINVEAPAAFIHHHGTFEIYYLLKGPCWYFIDQKSYRLTDGDIALIPPGVIHKASYETPTYSRKLVFCAEGLIPSSVRELLPQIPYFAASQETAPLIKEIFETIEEEYSHPDAFSMDVIRMKVAQLFLLIARHGQRQPQEKEESPIVERATRYIREHFPEAVTLQDAATFCYVSREHLSRIFKKETGFGFNEYLNEYRLKKANAMLREDPKCTVAEVALRCGFNDSNYFSRQYKKMYHTTASKTRKGD